MKSERGQALILIALGMVAMLALVALALDGGMAFAERRSSQNAVDNAALAAAYKMLETEDEAQAIAAAENILELNGYTDANSIITIPPFTDPSDICVDDGFEITVIVSTSTATSFGNIVGADSVDSTVRAVTRACYPRVGEFFWGNAVVGVNPGTSFEADSGRTQWDIQGGGIFANGDVEWHSQSCADSVAPSLTAVGKIDCSPPGASTQTGQSGKFVNYPKDVEAIMPPNPCVGGGVGKADPYEGKKANEMPKSPPTVNFSNGVYCITDFDKFDKLNIVLDKATLYVTDKSFSLNFSGSGGFSGTPTQSGTYAGYYMIVHLYPDQTCTDKNGKPTIVYAGNGLGNLEGTVLAPSVCIDVRGNSNNKTMDSQIIGHTIYSTGSSEFTVNFDAAKNAKQPLPPIIELLE